MGGDGSASRNLVGGWARGIVAGQAALVDGNRIGTNLTGTAAVPNTIGVLDLGSNDLRNNLISGNGEGVEANYSTALTYGNIVGLNAAGTAALPNGIGIAGHLPGSSAFVRASIGRTSLGNSLGCTVDPCNVISGNTTAGIQFDDPDVGLYLGGDYIGTDITGTKAIPNGIGIQTTSAALYNNVVGGPSRAVNTDTCVYPCNVIAGNTGPGISMTATGDSTTSPYFSGTVSGNFIGLDAAGAPLLNGGNQVAVAGAQSSNYPLTIGGTVPEGNVIANNSGRAISIAGSATVYPSVMVNGNEFRVLGTATPIERPPTTVNPPILAGYTVDGSIITVTGSTNVTNDPFGDADEIELYVSTGCGKPGVALPAGTGVASKLNDDFSINLPAAALIGHSQISALRTDGGHDTSGFSVCAAGPTVTSVTSTTPAGTKEVKVASNTGWKPGDYAEVDVPGAPVVREVSKLGSLILAVPVGKKIIKGTTIERVSPPKGDRTAPKFSVLGLPKHLSAGKKRVRVHFRCTDSHGVGVARCPAPITLKTRKAGHFTATVLAWDKNGNLRTTHIHYRVKPKHH